MPKPRIIQCLCGPNRHCILALGYEPGITAAQADFGSNDDVTLTQENGCAYLQGLIDGLIERGAMNPWCGICKARRARWSFEDRELPFRTLAAARPYLEQCERDQAATRQFLESSKS